MMPTNAYRLSSVLKRMQCEQRAEARCREARQNDQRLREALVKNAEDDVDDDDRHHEHEPEALRRLLKRLRRPLEFRGDRPWQCGPGGFLDGVHRIAERVARFEVERQVHRWKLAGMADRQRPDAGRHRRNGVERDELAVRRSHVQHRQRCGILLKLRRDLQNDLVLVTRRVDLRNLPRAVGVEQRRFHLIHGQSQRSDPVAVQADLHLWVIQPEIAVDVFDAVDVSHHLFERGGRAIELLGIRILQRELV